MKKLSKIIIPLVADFDKTGNKGFYFENDLKKWGRDCIKELEKIETEGINHIEFYNLQLDDMMDKDAEFDNKTQIITAKFEKIKKFLKEYILEEK